MMSISPVNLQALVAVVSFGLAVITAKIVVAINAGHLPGGRLMVAYLRMMLGFFLTAAVVLFFYSLVGKNILF